MGLLDYLGLDDLASDIREFTNNIDGLKDDLISSVMGAAEDTAPTPELDEE